MRNQYDVYAEGGPLPPLTPHDPFEHTVLNSAEHGEDIQREQMLHALLLSMPRPLTTKERQAAQDDPGLPPRVYAPASERVHKDPLPCDAEILESGSHHTIPPEAAQHPGDRSDPGELR